MAARTVPRGSVQASNHGSRSGVCRLGASCIESRVLALAASLFAVHCSREPWCAGTHGNNWDASLARPIDAACRILSKWRWVLSALSASWCSQAGRMHTLGVMSILCQNDPECLECRSYHSGPVYLLHGVRITPESICKVTIDDN